MKETRNEKKKLENRDTKDFLKVTLKLARPGLKLRFPGMLAVPHFLPVHFWLSHIEDIAH